jgi:predicted adenylyl cyclase CyaB
MGINIEIKAHCDNLESFKSKLLQLPVTFEGEDTQIDTFFRVSHGRLKLRESTIYGNILIPYLRPNKEGPKQSDYELIRVSNPQKVKILLGQILGIVGEVMKKRTIYLFENVRIHLDEVEQLGSFIEFEAVIDDEKAVNRNKEKTQWLLNYFNITDNQLIKVAYVDLIKQQTTP